MTIIEKAKDVAAVRITTKGGLLYRGGQMINPPESDRVAVTLSKECGCYPHPFSCAEQLVKHLEWVDKVSSMDKGDCAFCGKPNYWVDDCGFFISKTRLVASSGSAVRVVMMVQLASVISTSMG
jgi:hypothetical protein